LIEAHLSPFTLLVIGIVVVVAAVVVVLLRTGEHALTMKLGIGEERRKSMRRRVFFL